MASLRASESGTSGSQVPFWCLTCLGGNKGLSRNASYTFVNNGITTKTRNSYVTVADNIFWQHIRTLAERPFLPCVHHKFLPILSRWTHAPLDAHSKFEASLLLTTCTKWCGRVLRRKRIGRYLRCSTRCGDTLPHQILSNPWHISGYRPILTSTRVPELIEHVRPIRKDRKKMGSTMNLIILLQIPKH